MSKKNYNLIVTAHPDDETIFMGGLIQSQPGPWHVICVTDGNGDGRAKERSIELQKACQKLGVKKLDQWDFPDRYEQRLNLKQLEDKLGELPRPNMVYTHGPFGEYGHPHHQDVSIAVHRFFQRKAPVHSIAYNIPADETILLTRHQFKKKSEIYSQIYYKETRRFSHLLALSLSEGFVKVSLGEVEKIYAFLLGKGSLKKEDLKKFKTAWPFVKDWRKLSQTRSF